MDKVIEALKSSVVREALIEAMKKEPSIEIGINKLLDQIVEILNGR